MCVVIVLTTVIFLRLRNVLLWTPVVPISKLLGMIFSSVSVTVAASVSDVTRTCGLHILRS